MMSACFAKPPTEAVRSVAAADRAMMLVVPIAGHVRKRHRMCHTESSKGPFVDGSRADAAVRVRRAAEAISGRSRDAVGRSQEAERDNDVGFVLNRLRNVYKHRRLPLLAATLAREGGR